MLKLYLSKCFYFLLEKSLNDICVNPIRTAGCILPVSRFFANNFGSNKGTHFKLSECSKHLMPNKVKVTNFQH